MAKRGHDEGSIYQRGGDGLWCATVSLGYDDSGKRVRKTLYGKTRREVSRKLTEALAVKDAGLPQARQDVTVQTLIERWLEEIVKPRLAPKTYLSYEQMARVHLLPALGRVKLAELDTRQVQSFLRRKQESGLSARTVEYLRAILRRAVQQGVKWDWVARNVVALTDPPKTTKTPPPKFTDQQVTDLLKAIGEHRLANLFFVQLSLGLRLGEVLGLRVQDIERGPDGMPVSVNIQVQLQYQAGGTYSMRQPKSHAGRRALALPDMAIRALAAQQEALRALQQQFTEHELDNETLYQQAQEWGLLFRSLSGGPLHERNVRRDFTTLLERAGIPHLRTHDLRHLCATLLLKNGVSLRVIADILGHSQITLTANTYAHVLPSVRQEAAAALNQALGSSEPVKKSTG